MLSLLSAIVSLLAISSFYVICTFCYIIIINKYCILGPSIICSVVDP